MNGFASPSHPSFQCLLLFPYFTTISLVSSPYPFLPYFKSLFYFSTSCAKKAREKGFKYFSLGKISCTGYNEEEISVENVSSSSSGCQQLDLSDCNEDDILPACYGRTGSHYVYELVSKVLAQQWKNFFHMRIENVCLVILEAWVSS
jgi:hypothetical protein